MSIKAFDKAEAIFWDFDGVIKESVEVKSDAFDELFKPFGVSVAKRVREHHEKNGGMSRFDKFPIYFEWAGQELSQRLISEYSDQFSELVKQKVIDSEWVSGVFNYLKNNRKGRAFFLITATPQKEIEYIVNQLEIKGCFMQIIGSPTKKVDAIKQLLMQHSIKSEQAIMIGDSSSDYEASMMNKVPFILRRTELNKRLQIGLDCQMFDDFSSE